MQNWIDAIILGTVQGLTEFLPISSSAHLRIVGELLNASDPGAGFTAITQLGTETAVIIYFWKDIKKIISHWFLSLVGKIPRNDPEAKLGWYIILGSIPIILLGLLLEDLIDSVFRNLWLVATNLIIFGVILAIADYYGKKQKTIQDLTTSNAIGYGFAQALALIPGVSRSGGTITAGLFMGYTREAAARYSFLLAVPAVFGSGLYKLYGYIRDSSTETYSLPQTLVATVVAFAIGYIIIAWFLKYVSKHSYSAFVWYRIALGALIYILLGVGVLTP